MTSTPEQQRSNFSTRYIFRSQKFSIKTFILTNFFVNSRSRFL